MYLCCTAFERHACSGQSRKRFLSTHGYMLIHPGNHSDILRIAELRGWPGTPKLLVVFKLFSPTPPLLSRGR